MLSLRDQVRAHLNHTHSAAIDAERSRPAISNHIPRPDRLIFEAKDLLRQSDDPFEEYIIVQCALRSLEQLDGVIVALRELPEWSRICLRVGAFEDAIRIANLYLSERCPLRNEQGTLQALRCRAKGERNLGRLEAAENSFRELIRLAKQYDDPVELSMALLLIGKLNGNYRGQHSLFAAFVQEARVRLEAERRKAGAACQEKLIRYLAVAYDSLGQAFRSSEKNLAMRYFRHATRLRRSVGGAGSRSRCHAITLKLQISGGERSHRLLKIFEKEIKELYQDPYEEGGLAIRWLQYAQMLHEVGETEAAREHLTEARRIATKYSSFKVLTRIALTEFDFFQLEHPIRAVDSLLDGRKVALTYRLGLQEADINLRLATLHDPLPGLCPEPLRQKERNQEIHGALIEYARAGLSDLRSASQEHPEFQLLSKKTRDLFERNLLYDYEQALRRFGDNMTFVKTLLQISERRRQQAVALGLSNSLARAILHEVKLNLDERTGHSPVMNTASELRTLASNLTDPVDSPDELLARNVQLSKRFNELAHRLDHFDAKLGMLKELLLGRLRKIQTLNEPLSLREASTVAINDLRSADRDAVCLDTITGNVDIEIRLERQLLITAIYNLLQNAIQAYRRHKLSGPTVYIHLLAKERVIEHTNLVLHEPVMRILTRGLLSEQAAEIAGEIERGLRREPPTSPVSTGFGLELAESIFVQHLSGTLKSFHKEDEAGLEIIFNTNANRARVVSS